MVYSWLNSIQFSLLPGRCVLCSTASGRGIDLCPGCEQDLTRPWTRCQSCGLPAPVDTVACGQCAGQRYQFDRCIALAPYQAPIDRLIADFKYRRHLPAGRVLGKLLAQCLRRHYGNEPWPIRLIPVPLHWRRQWHRGFNQAHYLAHILNRELGIPLQTNCLKRCQATPRQQGMDRRQRRANLRDAFTTSNPVAGSHIALIDDVLTTGSTAQLLSGLLRDQGARRIDVWCLARTPSP